MNTGTNFYDELAKCVGARAKFRLTGEAEWLAGRLLKIEGDAAFFAFEQYPGTSIVRLALVTGILLEG